MGPIYESLGESVETLTYYLLGKIFYLLALFGYCNCGWMPPSNLHSQQGKSLISNMRPSRTWQLTHLVLLAPSDEGSTLKDSFTIYLKDSFTSYVMLYIKRYNLTPSMAYFANRTHGPEWFIRDFLAPLTN